MVGSRPAGVLGYDVFLSHSHVDKDSARALYDHLARTDYNGRMLRPWLDREVLDPGTLASNRELESALDRSRFLALALSPEAPESTGVQAEMGYFLRTRRVDDVIVLHRRPCRVPSELSRATRDWLIRPWVSAFGPLGSICRLRHRGDPTVPGWRGHRSLAGPDRRDRHRVYAPRSWVRHRTFALHFLTRGEPSCRSCRYCSGKRQIGQGVTKVKVGPVPACGQRGNAMGPAGACARHSARAVVALVLVLAR